MSIYLEKKVKRSNPMSKLNRNIRRQNRVRKNLKVRSKDKCRLTVFRSSKHIYAQIIDDASGKTIASASSLNAEFKDCLLYTSDAADDP